MAPFVIQKPLRWPFECRYRYLYRAAPLRSHDSGLRSRPLCSLQLVGLLLIGVAAWGKGFGLVSSIHIIGGVIAVGVFLLLIAIVGLIGALHHHQVMLFFVSFLRRHRRRPSPRPPRLCFFDRRPQYMVILFIVFLFQFGVSCSCLAVNRGQQVSAASR